MNSLDERGLTLTELALVGAMGFLVMSAIMAFYMNCQNVWTDASSKSITQREATGLSEHITELVHRSASVFVTTVGATKNCRVQLYYKGQSSPWYTIWWSPTDSQVHELATGGTETTNITSVVEKFEFDPCQPCNDFLRMTELRLRSAGGSGVSLSTSMALYNR